MIDFLRSHHGQIAGIRTAVLRRIFTAAGRARFALWRAAVAAYRARSA